MVIEDAQPILLTCWCFRLCLDRRATVYLPTGNLPMMPLELAAGACSLSGVADAAAAQATLSRAGGVRRRRLL